MKSNMSEDMPKGTTVGFKIAITFFTILVVAILLFFVAKALNLI